MVTSVARTLAPRIGVEGSRPLNVRFAEVLQQADRALRTDDERTGIFNLMASEASIDLIRARIDEVTRKRHVAEAPHPMVRQLCNEIYFIVHREGDGVNPLARKINDAQPRLLALRSDWRVKKLGSRLLPADCFVTLPLLDTERFSPKTIEESSAALDGVLTRHREALRIWALIDTALGFEKQPPDVQLMKLMDAVVEDERVLKRRVAALESEVAALRAIKSQRKQRKTEIT